MNELVKLVESWAMDKNLDTADPTKQFLKVSEEFGEIAAAMARSDRDALQDGIGDTVVTLIILAMQHGMSIEYCLQTAYDEIKGRQGVMLNGVFVKHEDIQQAITDADEREMWG